MDPRPRTCGQCGRHPRACRHQDMMYLDDLIVTPGPGRPPSYNGQSYYHQGQAAVGTPSGISTVQREQTVVGGTIRRTTGTPRQYSPPGTLPWSNIEGRSNSGNFNQRGEPPGQAGPRGSNRPDQPTDQYNCYDTPSTGYPYATMLDELEDAEYNPPPNGQQTVALASREFLGIPSEQTFRTNVYRHNGGDRRSVAGRSKLRTVRDNSSPESFASQTSHVDHQGVREHIRAGPSNEGPQDNGMANPHAADHPSMQCNARQRFDEEPYEADEGSEGGFESDSD